MPFKSKRQARAAFAGKIPGIDPHEWAHETKNMKKLPERAPKEKGKPTLRSKKAAPINLAAARGAARQVELQGGQRGSALRNAAFRQNERWTGIADKMNSGGYGPLGGPKADRAKLDRVRGVMDKLERRGANLHRAGDREQKAVSSFRTQPAASLAKTAAVFGLLEEHLVTAFKAAALGTAAMNPRNVGKLKGMMTTHALKAPGYAASTQAVNPGKSIVRAMNANKPH